MEQLKGYRSLTQEEKDLINSIKTKGIELESLINMLKANVEFDQRWISIGMTDIQKGLMALTRGIARPTIF